MTTATAIIAAGVFLTILGAAAALVIGGVGVCRRWLRRGRPDQDTQP